MSIISNIVANARGYITFRFDANKFKKDMKNEFDLKVESFKKNPHLYQQLLDLLGKELDQFVPQETGELARYYTDYKNGLMYRKISDDGFNVAKYQYNTVNPPRKKLTSPKYLYHFNTTGYTYHYKKGKVAPYSRTGYVYPRNLTVHRPGKSGIYHPDASDHWADKQHQSIIWDEFCIKAKPLIVAAMKKGKK